MPFLARRPLTLVAAALLLTLPWTAVTVAQAPPGAPPPSVGTQPVETREVSPSAEFVGRTQAIASFDARARVEGFVEEVAFEEGQDVQEGQLLYRLEQAPYRAQLTQAQAQLQRAQARHIEATQAFQRAQELSQRGNVSEAALEEARAASTSAEADVLAAQAVVDAAQLNLDYTEIRSPIAGRIGATAVTEGNLVNPATGVLATVARLDPIRVVFSVSDRDLLETQRQFGASSPSELIDRFVPTLELADGQTYPHPGRLEFVDNRIDQATGTVSVRALFPNPNRLLLPGQFVTVRVRQEEGPKLPVVPVTAIQRDREGAYVLVVGPENKVDRRPVELGSQVGQSIAVQQGLQGGESIIVQGQQKVAPGMTVAPTPVQTAEQPRQSGATSPGQAPSTGAGGG